MFHSSLTSIALRHHQHFPDTSNMSNVIGPISLSPWASVPKLMVKDKREFWAARRRAVGGRSKEDSGSDPASGDESQSEGVDDEELPDVGGGRGTKGLPETSQQPVSYHTLPKIVSETLHYAFWGSSTIDLTPGIGDLCADNVCHNIGYLGI